MRKVLTRLKALVDWAGTAYTVVGWFGGTAAVTGIFAAIGGAVWAVVRGVPLPIAIMAGYCTIAGAGVLTMAPLAYRALSRMAAAPVPHGAVMSQKPNPDVWRHLPKFTLNQAAWLLADVVPPWSSGKMEGDAQGWYDILRAEIQSKQIAYIPSSLDKQNRTRAGVYYPDHGTEISREELQRFAERCGIRPRFLFPD